MKSSELKNNEQVLAEQLRVSPEFAAEWKLSELARGVSIFLIRYRAERGLSEVQLALQLDLSAELIEILELGEIKPSKSVLDKLVERLDMTVTLFRDDDGTATYSVE